MEVRDGLASAAVVMTVTRVSRSPRGSATPAPALAATAGDLPADLPADLPGNQTTTYGGATESDNPHEGAHPSHSWHHGSAGPQ